MDGKYLSILMKEVNKAIKKEEVPVAALIINEHGKIIAKSFNKREKSYRTIDHAEIICINKANKCMKNKILDTCEMYVTLEPCEMCKLIIKEARIKNVYYLLSRNSDKKSYSKTNFIFLNNNIDFKKNYQHLLSDFFKKRR